MQHGKLLGELPEPGGAAEEVRELFAVPGLKVERIVSHQHISPPGFWYDQPSDEFVMLVSGAAELEFDDGSAHEMGRGYWVRIPARRRHRVAWTCEDGPTVWLAIHFDAGGSD